MADLSTYFPRLRILRPGPPTPAPAAGFGAPAAPPRTRAIWFEIITNATSRTTTSTPPLVGPALIKRITARVNAGADPPAHFLELGVSPVQILETNVALTATKNWRPLFDDMDPRSANVAAGLKGFMHSTSLSTGDHAQFDLDALVFDASFRLILSNENAGAAVQRWVGYVTVVEGISQAALANFL